MQVRPELWQRAATRVAAAGGPGWELAPFVRDSLRSRGVQLLEQPLCAADGTIASQVAAADVLISGMARIDDAVAAQLRNVRFVLRPYVGYDDIDPDALARHGILFANVPDAFIEEVANHALALILACNRKLFPTDAFVRGGAWSAGAGNREASVPIRRTSALTLGLVGFGNIARLVVERARPFGFRLIATDPYVSTETFDTYGLARVSLEDLLAQSDVVSLHVFLNAETRHLMNAERLGLMRRDAFLVNTSRGPVVDERALVDALAARHLAGAALDVFEVEPVPRDSRLLGMPNVILTSHTASYSEEGDVAHNRRTLQIIEQVLDGGLPERKVVVTKTLYDALSAAATARSPQADQLPAPR